MRLTGAQIVAQYLIREGVPYLFGVSGHGNTALLDAFVEHTDEISVLQAMHEQGAAHMADAFYRVSGQVCGVYTSIGPGAVNTTMGVANAYIDSIPLLLLCGSVHTYMRGHGVLQELERTHWANFPRIMEPIVKRWWQPSRVDQLPFVLHRAFNSMLEGRRGPVLLDLPMDLQAESADVELPEPSKRRPSGRIRADHAEVQRAAQLLLDAERPVILAGGGVVSSDASEVLLQLAERLGAPVTTSWMGKGAFPEDHPLYAWPCGDIGALPANRLVSESDVLLVVGSRITDRIGSSFRHGTTFSVPPTKLIHVDLDPYEIGKNYPVELGLVGDANCTLADLLTAIEDLAPQPRSWYESAHYQRLCDLRKTWFEQLAQAQGSDRAPMTISRALVETRRVLKRDAIVVTGAGNPQSQVYNEFPVYLPRTHITAGGFSAMGFEVPGAIGAKLAAPDRQVLGIAGDGGFLQTAQELAMAAQYDIPVVILVLNNMGWECIKNLQETRFGPGRTIATSFNKADGSPFSAHLADVAQALGCYGQRVTQPAELGAALLSAFDSGRPAVVEAMCAQGLPWSAISGSGWWDVTVPEYHLEARAEYERARSEERL